MLISRGTCSLNSASIQRALGHQQLALSLLPFPSASSFPVPGKGFLLLSQPLNQSFRSHLSKHVPHPPPPIPARQQHSLKSPSLCQTSLRVFPSHLLLNASITAQCYLLLMTEPTSSPSAQFLRVCTSKLLLYVSSLDPSHDAQIQHGCRKAQACPDHCPHTAISGPAPLQGEF